MRLPWPQPEAKIDRLLAAGFAYGQLLTTLTAAAAEDFAPIVDAELAIEERRPETASKRSEQQMLFERV